MYTPTHVSPVFVWFIEVRSSRSSVSTPTAFARNQRFPSSRTMVMATRRDRTGHCCSLQTQLSGATKRRTADVRLPWPFEEHHRPLHLHERDASGFPTLGAKRIQLCRQVIGRENQ
jgi:hypothetical protein